MTEEQEKQESQKTLVAFVAGLLIGGLLVWVFGGSTQDKSESVVKTDTDVSEEVADKNQNNSETATVSEPEDETSAPSKMQTGDGGVDVSDQPAGLLVTLDSATFPSAEGWVGVRSFPNGQIGSILGASRYSENQGLVPSEIELLVPTITGRTYAITFFTEDGDRIFNPAYDVQMDTEISTFIAK